MSEFILKRMSDLSDAALIVELRRVADLVSDRSLTFGEFNKHGRVTAATVMRKFGVAGWKACLEKAGLSDRYRAPIPGQFGAPARSEFILKRMSDLSDAALIAELRRVADLVPNQPFTRNLFEEHGRVGITTLRRHLGDWKACLEKAGLSNKYKGAPTRLDEKTIISELKHIATVLGKNQVTKREYQKETGHSADVALKRFGSWRETLRQAGLIQSWRGHRYTDEECFENLLKVWTHFGRQPKHREMAGPPSTVGGKAYVLRWGTWIRALEAFVERVNADDADAKEPSTSSRLVAEQHVSPSNSIAEPKPEPRDAPLGLRYKVLLRDRFRCVICGRSPAKDLSCELHVDHIHPASRGGRAIPENLRTLCSKCNLGKSDSIESPVTVGS